MDNQNIYIIGIVKGTSRTQNLIKFLLDQNRDIFYNSLETKIFFNKKGFKGILRKILRGFEETLKYIDKVYNILISDIVVLPAMCNNYQFDLYIAKILKKTIITDFYISFYDTWVLDRNEVDRFSKQAKKLLSYDVNCISNADYVLFLNSTERKYYLDILNIPYNINKHLIVPLCIEESIKTPNSYYSKNFEERVFNICWWGGYIPLHGLEKIISACNILNKEYELNFHLYLFGSSDGKNKEYLDLISSLNLSSVISIDNTSTFKNGKLGNFLQNNCDLVLGNFGDSEKAKKVLVNKLIDGVAMKSPVLTGESVAPHEYFSENEIFYTLNTPESMAAKMYFISQLDAKEIQNRVDKAYLIYLKEFSVNAYTNKMKEVLDRINSEISN
ncbi:hypothetical protein [Flavobacterium sp. DSR3-2]|uniref:hypothetical protein n=1 Tax=Flavobacterium sp. DSR3-2 TaxID=2804634 RepID=UPI003CE72127